MVRSFPWDPRHGTVCDELWRMNKLPFALAALFAAAACGGSVVNEATGGATGTGAGASTMGTGAGTTGTGAGTTGTGAATTGTGAATTGVGGGEVGGPCPPSAPLAEGDVCSLPEGFRCTYGDSVRPECRTAWTCNGAWTATSGPCDEPPPGVCGSSQPGPQDMCAATNAVCVYGDSLCLCGCGAGVLCTTPFNWFCTAPPTTPGCPEVVPNDGTLCAVPGVQCSYGDVCTPSGAMVSCTNGLWLWNTMIACGG
jgi:hypothetical protein